MKISDIVICLSLITACTPTELSYTPIRNDPTSLDYAVEVCRAEANAVGYSVKQSVAAATPDLKGSDGASGFASGFANGMQGTGEGRKAEAMFFKACMAREGYRVMEK